MPFPVALKVSLLLETCEDIIKEQKGLAIFACIQFP
jgi:hypothetical protein